MQKIPILLQLWHHHGGISGNLASRLLPSVKQQLPVRGTVGWQLQRKISCPHFLALYSCNPNSFSGLLLLLRIMMFWFLPVTIQSKPPVTTNQPPVTKQQDTLTPSPLRSLETLLCVQKLLCQMFIDFPFQASDFDFCSSDMG